MLASQPSVLVLTERFDPTADVVVEELNRRDVSVFRCDTAEFPEVLQVEAEFAGSGWSGQFRTVRRKMDLDAITGIYYRRLTNFVFHPDMSAAEGRWAGAQARMGFGGLLATLEPWLNHPHHIGFAEYKPVQLRIAADAGLLAPRTLLTNDPAAAHAFAASCDKVVYKPFTGTGINDPDGYRQIFTTPVTAEQCEDPAIARTMHLFQEWVPKDYEVRLTVVDSQFFAARIDAASIAAYTDWRADYDTLTYTAVETPAFVRNRVADFLDRLHLRFGALDFVVAPDGEWWFLECNPNGQWAWIEEATGLPIAAAIADALEGITKP
jgi:ATP-grasp ribosomal peptide maturase